MMRKFKIYSSKIEYEDEEESDTPSKTQSYTLDHTVISYLMSRENEYLNHLGASLSAHEIYQKILDTNHRLLSKPSSLHLTT